MTTETLPARISRSMGLRGGDVFGDLQNEMDSFLSRFSRGWDGHGANGFAPALDLSEVDDMIQAKMDIPGIKPEEIDIQVNGDMLRVAGERHEEEMEDKGTTFHWTERRTGAFARTVRLPCIVEGDKVTAEYKDGILSISLPKSEHARSHRIPVKPA